jgi:5-(carboxyamino)imidazole ribonucleotide synthase
MTHRTIVPPSRVGILGGGQLGRYAVVAARTMGYRTTVLEPDPAAPAGAFADDHIVAAYDDHRALQRLAIDCDVITTEFENPPATALEVLAQSTAVAPSAHCVSIAQDRAAEKAFLLDNGFPVGPYVVVNAPDDPVTVEFPAVVKTTRLGYDGRGQRRVASEAETYAAWSELGGVATVVESLLPLDLELSVVVARTADARTAVYEVAENHHVAGILDLTVVPARVSPDVADRAAGIALAVADALGYVGVLAVELFVVGDEIFVNELAPRPHNSGHWTLDAARTDQFEQQIRAVCGIALGPTDLTAPAVAMVNLLGDLWMHGEPQWARCLDDPAAHLHLYGKSTPRTGRKMGHLTVIGSNSNEVADHAHRLRAAVVNPG